MDNRKKIRFFLFMMMSFPFVSLAQTRIKDLTHIRGVRNNQLIGYGLVVGLAASGDTAAAVATRKVAAAMMMRLGISTLPEEMVTGSYAAVVVTAELPPFSRNGDKLDVRVSTLADAVSLSGGTLLLTPLRAGDGETYVMAQGAVTTGSAKGKGTEILTVANVHQGGMVEREYLPTVLEKNRFSLILNKGDFSTNTAIVKEINKYFGGFYAKSLNFSTIAVEVPPLYHHNVVPFIATLENISVEVHQRAKVVINEKTGTIVMGSEVTIAPVSISHGNLAIVVKGEKETKESSVNNIEGSSVGELVQSLNLMGAKPQDLVDILRTMSVAGALHADLETL